MCVCVIGKIASEEIWNIPMVFVSVWFMWIKLVSGGNPGGMIRNGRVRGFLVGYWEHVGSPSYEVVHTITNV